MSKLASKIASSPAPPAVPVKRGPDNCCFPLYGTGDLEDFEAVEALRIAIRGERPALSWREVQEHIDRIAGVTQPLPLEKFRYHWRRFCSCWPVDLRR